MPSITTRDGVRLDYLDSAGAGKRPVVLIAGFKLPATSWKAQHRELVKAGYRVIALDRRGHGSSELGDVEHNTLAQHGADVRQLLEELDLRGAVLIGGSVGGDIIWSAIRQGAGDRIGGVVVVDQTPKMLNSTDWPHGFYGYDEGDRELFESELPVPSIPALLKKGPVRLARIVLAHDLTRAGAGLLSPERELLHEDAVADWRPVIARFEEPVLFVAGAQSEFWPSSHAAAAAAIAPRGRSIVFEKTGHVVNIERPKPFNAAMFDFLRELPAPEERAARVTKGA